VHVTNNAKFAPENINELRPSPAMHTTSISGAEAFTIRHRTGDQAAVRMKRSSYFPLTTMTTFQLLLVISAGENGESHGRHVVGAASPHVMFIMGRIEEPERRNAFDHRAFDEPYFIGCSESLCPSSSCSDDLSLIYSVGEGFRD
jgi:hypothetical protein